MVPLSIFQRALFDEHGLTDCDDCSPFNMAPSKGILMQFLPLPTFKSSHRPARTQLPYSLLGGCHTRSPCKRRKKSWQAPTMPWRSCRVLWLRPSRPRSQTSRYPFKVLLSAFEAHVLLESNSFPTVRSCPQQRSKPCKVSNPRKRVPHRHVCRARVVFTTILLFNLHLPALPSALKANPRFRV